MDCTESIPLLSDFHDGALDNTSQAQVKMHLAGCPPCSDIFADLAEIVNVAVALNLKQGIPLPDEDEFWKRLKIAGRQIH